MHESAKSHTKKIPPDGGWGWMVVLSYAIFFTVFLSVLGNFAIIYKDKIDELQLQATDVAVIQNFNFAVGCILGLISAPLINVYGCRAIALASGVFYVVGLMLTTVAYDFTTFLLSYGILTSVGFGFGFTSFFVSMTSYFEKHRNKASGLAMTIGGFGPIVYPQLVTLLLRHYDVNGSVMILAAIGLHVLVAALLLQPVEWHMKTVTISDEEMASLATEREHGNRKLSLLAPSKMSSTTSLNAHHLAGKQLQHLTGDNQRKMSKVSLYAQFVSKFEARTSECAEPSDSKTTIKCGRVRRACNWLVDIFDLTLLRDRKFVFILFGVCLSDFAEINFAMVMPFILDEHKYSATEVADFLSILAIADIVFRLLAPYIGNFLRQSARPMFVYGLVALILARTAIQLSNGYVCTLIGCILSGLGRAVTMVYMNVVIPNCVPMERLPAASGIFMLMDGLFVIIGGPFIGLLRDITGNYATSIVVLNLVTIIAIVAWLADYSMVLIREKWPKRPATFEGESSR